jgi:mannose-6-phosphate isomerase-like protein (cupin superfamily)
MSYPPQRHEGPGQVGGRLRPAHSPPDLIMPSGVEVHHLATGATTAGDFGLYRWEMPAGPSGPGAHFHRTMSESFYVLSGTVGLYDGLVWVDAGPGDFLFVPAGGIHAFRNRSGPASMLILFTPGAPREAYFQELAEIASSERILDEQEWAELWARHDQYPA